LEQEMREQQQREGALRQAQVGTGDRSAKVRTYNFPQGRITDHRIGLTSHNLEATLAGDLEDFTQALAAKERSDKLAAEATSTPG
jgi:peptide chain release factor 1